MRKIIFAGLVAAFLVAGCGGGSDKKGTPATSPGGTTATTTTGNTGNSNFDAILDKASKARFRVTYKSSTSEHGDESLFTLSQDGNGKSAYFSSDGDSQFIVDGDTIISCDNLKSTPRCTQTTGPQAQALVSAYTGLFLGPQTAIQAGRARGFGNTSSETIAGRDAACVSVDFAAAQWKYCADKESGVVLKWEGSSGGKSASFVATEAGDPKDSDFTPPVTPETVPSVSLPEGITLPGG